MWRTVHMLVIGKLSACTRLCTDTPQSPGGIQVSNSCRPAITSHEGG